MKQLKRWISTLLVLCLCLSIVPIQAKAATYATYTGVDFQNASISAQRKAALTKAMQMVTVKWTCPADFPTWRSSGGVLNTVVATDGTSSTKFIKGKIYTGIPYSMADHTYDDIAWANAISSGKITTSYMTGSYYGNGSTTAHGSDCSYFVYLALKAANAGSISYQTTATMLNSSYYKKIDWSDLKPADLFLKNGHVMMFVGMSGSNYAVFESDAGDSKCSYNVYTKSQLSSYGCYRYANFNDENPIISTGLTPVDIGTNFTAVILNKNIWKPIENSYTEGDKPPVRLANEDGFANQVWHFTRQSDGSYKIASCYDGKYLDVRNASTSMNTIIQTCIDSGSDAQKWYICEYNGGYVFVSKLCNYVMDLNNNDGTPGNYVQTHEWNKTNAQIWSIYRGQECVLKGPSLTVSVGDSKSATVFNWGNVYAARNYNIKIWKGTAWDGEQYAGANYSTSGYSIVLPAGTYQAYVDAVHQFDYEMSNLVTFTVKEHTHSNTYKITKSPTTSTTGTLTGTCSKCSGTTTVTLPKLNTTDYTYKVTKAATCTASGTGRYTWKTTTYGTFYFDVSIAATGHSYSYKVIKSPTTSATGTLTGTCSKCSGTTTITLPKLDTTNYTYKVTKAATCTASGTGRYTWKNTTYGTFYFDVSIAATGHSYGNDGVCTRCGHTVAPKTYTISYNANGGSGAPSNQTKQHGTPLTLSSSVPTGKFYSITFNGNGGTVSESSKRVYQQFESWNTNVNGTGPSYVPGGTYSADEDCILYAQWDPAVFGKVADPFRDGYYFLGWYDSTALSSDGLPTGTRYSSSTKINSNITLYAMWALTSNLYYGDVDIDGSVTTSDVFFINKCMQGKATPEYSYEEFLLRADLDRDREITDDDLMLVNKLRLGNLTQADFSSALKKVTVSAVPQDSYAYGESLSTAGLSIEILFDTGTSYTITKNLTVSGYDPYESGTQTLMVQYYQFSTTYTVTVSPQTYTISYNANGGSGAPSAQVKVHGTTMNLSTVVPVRSGYTFLGWATRSDATTASYQPGAIFTINANTTLYAVWKHICANGHSFGSWVVLKNPTASEEGIEARTCTRCNYTEQRTIPKTSNPFTDVPAGCWYEAPVLWALENGITDGTSATTFSPGNQCLRAHVVTFLWNAEKTPEPTAYTKSFSDVPAGAWYYKPVHWAVEHGITSGVSDTKFGAGDVCSRYQVVFFLWKAAGSPEPKTTVNPFTDVNPGHFFYKAVLWAVENGITSGTSATTFGPTAPCNRAQVVTFLYAAYN